MGDVTFSGQGLVVIGALLTALVSAIGILFRKQDETNRLLLSAKDARTTDIAAERDFYRSIAFQAVHNLEKARGRLRAERGLQPFTPEEPQVPHHNSPATQEQVEAAVMKTLTMRLVAAITDLNELSGEDAQPATDHYVEERAS